MIDEIDKKILFELDMNSRRSLSEIALKTGVSKEKVHYRIQKMLENSVIRGFYAVIDLTKLGYTKYKYYIKLHNVRQEVENEIIKNLCKINNSTWVATIEGYWNLAVTVVAKDLTELNSVNKQIGTVIGEHLFEKNVSTVSDNGIFCRNYLNPTMKKFQFPHIYEGGNRKVDELDMAILRILSKDSSMSISYMARLLASTRDKVKYRIKKLKEDKVIVGWRTFIDLEKIGYDLYKIVFRLNDIIKRREIITFCKRYQSYVEYLKLVGETDLEIEIEISHKPELRNILDEIRTEFSDFILGYNILDISHEHKVGFFPTV